VNRRLWLVFLLVAGVGVARLSMYGYRWWQSRDTTSAKWANQPTPQSPPSDPPPGRPFSAQGAVYEGAAPSLESLREAVRGTNLAICVLDAARVDRFSAYGYPRLTTPNFDRLARKGLLFDQHFCQAPHTSASTASLFTSQYPDTHGVLFGATPRSAAFRGLDPGAFTLEKALKGRGYDTYLFSANIVASPRLGVGEDFASTENGTRGQIVMSSDPVAGLKEALAETEPGGDTRFFAYLHVLPPHEPYSAPKEIADLFAQDTPPRHWEGEIEFPELMKDRLSEGAKSWVTWGNCYDANLRWADTFVGELEKVLKQAGILENTLLIVTADHGEALGEHGYNLHAGVPYDEALHIPLLIRFPGAHPPVGRVEALTQTIDLLPTLLDLYGAPYPRAQVQGKSLLPLLTGRADKVNDYLFARATGWSTACYTIRDAHTTLLLYRGGKPRALYDMDADPYQTRNLITSQPARAEKLTQAFGQFARAQKYPPLNFLDPSYQPPTRNLPTAKMSEETKRRLKSLGYLK